MKFFLAKDPQNSSGLMVRLVAVPDFCAPPFARLDQRRIGGMIGALEQIETIEWRGGKGRGQPGDYLVPDRPAPGG
jgi:hypothetical protein